MLKINEVLNMWSEDSKLDETELTKESIKIPLLHSKYLRIYHEAKSMLRKLFIKRSQLSKTLREYYNGDLNNPEDLDIVGREPFQKRVLKSELDSYVNSDSELVSLNEKIAYLEEYVNTCQEIIKNINNRGYIIKNAIDYLKFCSGAN